MKEIKEAIEKIKFHHHFNDRETDELFALLKLAMEKAWDEREKQEYLVYKMNFEGMWANFLKELE